MADDGGDQRVLPGAAEAAIGQAVEILRAFDRGTVGVEDDAAGLRLDDGVDRLQVGARALLGEQAERPGNAEIGDTVGNRVPAPVSP
ncbi:hypothetical protein MesoLj131a_44710 [Mesorhizobium sp. 131-2-1]|nr:hypothetical protein MesoLj131a_44710 [Mesorhizobium sp. 131-2-1]